MIVVGERLTFTLLKKVREFVFSGGNAALFIFQCETGLQKDLQLSFEISCADARLLVNERRRGEQMAPFLHGLVMDIREISIDFVPGPSRRFECVAKLQGEDRTGCTALSGNVGNGKAIFMDRGTLYSYASAPAWFEDKHFHDADHREAASKLLNWLVEEAGGSRLRTNSFDAVSALARFSTADPTEGEERADAVGQTIKQYQSGDVDQARALDLLHTIAPELSIEERKEAADKLAQISGDDQWDEGETAEGVSYLASLITGDEPNPGERVEAAHEMVELYEAGDLDSETSLSLMDTSAPGLSINERRQAAAALAKLSADDDWDDANRMAAASEVFRLVTGVPLDAEARMGAAAELAGVGVRIFDADDSFDDSEIETATEIINPNPPPN